MINDYLPWEICNGTTVPKQLIPLLLSEGAFTVIFSIECLHPHIAVFDVAEYAGEMIWICVAQNCVGSLHSCRQYQYLRGFHI